MTKKLSMLQPAVKQVSTEIAARLPTSLAFADDRRGSAHSRGYDYRWQKLRLRILERDNYRCQCADCQASGWPKLAQEVDHVVNKANGGTDDPSNLQSMNRDCHAEKTRREAAAARGGGVVGNSGGERF